MEKRRQQFDGLRGILALWILFGHLLLHERYHSVYDAGFARHEDFGLLGNLAILHFIAVDLFFMLSGLVLTLRYADHFTAASTGRAIDQFYLKRIKRVWPLHAAMVGIIGIFILLGIPHPISSGLQNVIFAHWGWTLALNLLLMNGWGIIPVASWNEPAWTLSITFLLYIIFPNLLLALKRLPRRAIIYWIGIVALIIGYALLRQYVLSGGQSDGAGGIARGICFFSVGCLLGLYSRLGPNPYWQKHSAAFIFLFIAMVVYWPYAIQFPLTWLHFTYPLLLLALLARPRGWLPPRLTAWLGDRSFALFITHYPTLLLIRYYCGTTLAQWAAEDPISKTGCYLLVVGICLLVADLSHRFIERPIA